MYAVDRARARAAANSRGPLAVALASLLLGLLVSCARPATQLVVVVNTDLPMESIARVRVDVTRVGAPSDAPRATEEFLIGSRPNLVFPFSFGVTPPGGDASRRVLVEAHAIRSDGVILVSRSVRTGFLSRQSLQLSLFLSGRCTGVTCSDPSLTCDLGSCVPLDVEPETLTTVAPGEEIPDAAVPSMLDATIGLDAPPALDAAPRPDAPDAVVALDAGPPSVDARLRFPWNGLTTGSVHVPVGASVVDHPLRPKVVWEAVADADEYQVQLTSECETATFRSCAFASPTIDERTASTTFRPATPLPVSMSAPVGRRYYVRVRACRRGGGCSGWTEVRYLDVGRHPDDFNGDGYGDLVVGANLQNDSEDDEGAAYVYHGSASGPRGTPDVELDNPLDQVGGHFGVSVASAGDINGDGYADLVVGGDQQDYPTTDEGMAFVYHGSASGLRPMPDVLLDNPRDQVNGAFGCSVAGAGDVNGDGYSDVVVGACYQDGTVPDEGAAYVYYGSALGLRATPQVSLDNPLDIDGFFGWSVAGAGDVNGDGYPDVVVGAFFQSVPEPIEGAAYLYYGAAAGLPLSPDATLDNPLDQTLGLFGHSVASAGDVNGDGYADVVVGAPSQNDPAPDDGAAYVYYGSASGLGATPGVSLENPLGQESGAFGHSVASAGDINGDGYADIVVGANGQGSPEDDEGAAYVYYGSASGLPTTPDVSLDNPSNQVRGFFGHSVARAGDVDGDGYADVVVGALKQNQTVVREGAVYLYRGSASGLPASPDVSLDNPLDETDGNFGASVASVCGRRGSSPRANARNHSGVRRGGFVDEVLSA